MIDFLERVSRAVEDDWLGLTLAADFDLREIGMLYYVAASSQRFGDALKRLERYVRVADEALVVRIVQGSGCRVGLSYVGVPRHTDRHLMECLCGHALAALPPACRKEDRALSGELCAPSFRRSKNASASWAATSASAPMRTP